MSSRVLLVDDSSTIRSIIRVYLMGADVEFLEADRADKALELLATQDVDLVVVDFNMPGLDGASFIERLRGHPRSTLRSVPVVLLTAEKAPEIQARGAQAGATDFIRKPVTSASLRETVGKYVQLAKAPAR